MSQTNSDPATFATLGVPAALVATLTKSGITSPFAIQTATLPDTLAGRDVLGRGRTGSGKTLAFALPVVSRLARLVPSGVEGRTQPGRPRGLVLAPTRELANQIHEVIEPMAAAAGLRVMTIFGGVSQHGQVQQLRRGVDVVVATPGRLEDLMKQGVIHLDGVAVTILDEADHMADLGFLPGVTRILSATPAGGQRMMFSATLDSGVDKLVKRFLSRPLVHSVDSEDSPVGEMTHHVFLVRDASQKKQIIHELAGGTSRRLLFTRTKHQAKKLARELTADGIPAVELHGNLSQNARERGLKAFADGKVRVMVATDIAARGIHVDDIDLVIHVDPPAEHKAYLHRSGRTARAGNEGDVITLVLPEQRRDFQQMARAAKITAVPASVHSGDARVLALVGSQAAPIAPGDAPAAASRKGVEQEQQSRRSNSPRQRSSAPKSSNSRGGGDRAARAHISVASNSGDAVVRLSRQGGGGGGGRRRPTGRTSSRLSA